MYKLLTSYSLIFKFPLLILNISLIFIYSYIFSVESDLFEYNYVDFQNHEIDLAYSHLLGINMYFFPSYPDNTSLFIATVIPDLSLQIGMKLYTNNTEIINVIENQGSLYFGFDFNLNNTDISLPDIRSDIIVCCFDEETGECEDFIYSIENKTYIDNSNGKVMKNNLIPIGINNTDVDVIMSDGDVLDYKAYFSVLVTKYYYAGFDNVTMLNWLNYKADKLNVTINGFYGIETGEKCGIFKTGFKANNTYYFGTQRYHDGAGLTSGGARLDFPYLININQLIIVLFHLIIFL